MNEIVCLIWCLQQQGSGLTDQSSLFQISPYFLKQIMVIRIIESFRLVCKVLTMNCFLVGITEIRI